MNLLFQIIVLAVLQGLTEFLPISSDGHLAIGAAIFEQLGHPLPEVHATTIALHVGTLVAILVFFRQRFVALLKDDRRVIGLIVVGTVPAVIFGVLAKLFLEDYLTNPVLTGLMLPLTGVALLWGARHQDGTAISRELTYFQALIIGLCQAFALLPGISRSGMTIASGLAVGLRRDEAATFSFLLGTPAIAGAAVLEALLHLLKSPQSSEPVSYMLLGILVSFVVGLLALQWLIRWLREGVIHYFAWWVIPLGIGVLIWQGWPT